MPDGEFVPMQAAMGGAFIGVASGFFMILTANIAGNSGALKSFVLMRTSEPAAIAFVCGLITSGIIAARAMPDGTFEKPVPHGLSSLLGGITIGLGTYLGSGCTSGHGLCGLSRFSLRALVAVPTFVISAMVSAVFSAEPVDEVKISFVWPPAKLSSEVLLIGAYCGGVLGSLLLLGVATIRMCLPDLAEVPRKSLPVTVKAASGLWCGACCGVGLSFGGMVRPSTVQGGLNVLQPIDLTLWILFGTALVVTFILYRVAEGLGITQARVDAATPAKIDKSLILGAVLFGVGWGSTGFCPGPLIVSVAATPDALSPVECLIGVTLGMHAASALEGHEPSCAGPDAEARKASSNASSLPYHRMP